MAGAGSNARFSGFGRVASDSDLSEVEEEAPRRNHGMTLELVLRFNRLAEQCGFDM